LKCGIRLNSYKIIDKRKLKMYNESLEEKMLEYNGFNKLLNNYKDLLDGMLYSVEKKENDLNNAIFYVVDANETKTIEYVEGDLGEVPEKIYNDQDIVCELIETKIFKDIIENKIKQNNNLDINKNIKVFLNAFEFYLEYDTFQE
jgi:hypothetical protein